MSKGDNPRPYSVSMAEYDDQYKKIFGPDKKVEPGRWMHDKETGKLIPAHEYHAKYPKQKFGDAPMIMSDIEPYVSTVTDKLITSRSQHREDLRRTGCRVYEGREAEEKEAARVRAYQDKKFEQIISEGVEKTVAELRDGMIKPETRIKSEWALGLD